MSGITTEYFDLSNGDRLHDGDTIMQVYREFGFGWSFARSLQYPGMLDPRPTNCPPTIDAFLWGGLSTAVTEAFMPAATKRTRLSYGVTFFTLILVLGPLIGMSMTPFQWLFPSADGETSVSFLYYILYSLSIVLMSRVLLYWLVRPLAARADNNLRIAIEEMKPHFHKVGHDLVYETPGARCGAYDAYVRITAATSDAEHQLYDDAVVEQPVPIADFRVLVYGSSCGSYWMRVMGLKHGIKDNYVFTEGRPAELKVYVDKFTWGAVATELRPLTLDYASKWKSLQFNGFLLYVVWLHFSDYVDASIAGEIVTFALVYIVPAILYSCILQTYFMKKLHGEELRVKLEEKIQNLSSMVEARSGYSLRCDSNGHCESFVCFQSRDNQQAVATAMIV